MCVCVCACVSVTLFQLVCVCGVCVCVCETATPAAEHQIHQTLFYHENTKYMNIIQYPWYTSEYSSIPPDTVTVLSPRVHKETLGSKII